MDDPYQVFDQLSEQSSSKKGDSFWSIVFSYTIFIHNFV